METVFTWSGTCFGHKDGDRLWNHRGRHVGTFIGSEIYGTDGRYLGELRNGKLITKKSKKSKRRSGFTPRMNRSPRVKSVDRVGSVMLAGYEDFPALTT